MSKPILCQTISRNQPQIYTTGAFISPERRIVDGREEWFWKVDEFDADSYCDGERCDPVEFSTTKADLFCDGLRKADGGQRFQMLNNAG